ncbi:hypothetical protein [Streptomyces sp. NPDC012825]|uniref:hypothetical protein n=1 Tax=Streptomyces sp. NPDC012825 TaxID=3364851 RepID=UPI0036738012
MDVLDSLNSGLSYDLVLELTVHGENQEDLTKFALGWLTHGIDAAISVGGVGVPSEGLPVSATGFKSASRAVKARSGKWWGHYSVAPRDSFEVLYNPLVCEVIPWVTDMVRARPESLEAKIGEFSGSGEIGNSAIRLSLSFDEDLPSYVKLSYYISDDSLYTPDRSQREHARLLAAANWACRNTNVVFGHFSYVHTEGATELERCLRGPARVPSWNTPKWRKYLRGYSWLMVVPREISDAAGGVGTLLESGAFESISSFPNGSILLQATPTFREYEGEKVRAVQHIFREFLITGEFRHPAPVPGQPPMHMVIFND